MKCPSCDSPIQSGMAFCTHCSQKLPELIKEKIREEINSELSGMRTFYQEKKVQNPPGQNKRSYPAEAVEPPSSPEQTIEARDVEYREILEGMLADGKVTPEELILLNEKRKVLGLSQTEALEIQKDAARQRGINPKAMGDLSTALLLEINTNKDYFVGEMNNLEFRITNRSGMGLERVCLFGHFEMLGKNEERSISRMIPQEQHVFRLPFKHTDLGQELVEIRVHYFDDQGNPSVLKTEIEIGISARNEKREDRKSINLTVTAGKMMGVDLSHMAEIYEGKRQPQVTRHSFYEDPQKNWKCLPIFFDEEETNRWRDQILIDKKMAEGESNYKKGADLIYDSEQGSARDKVVARQNLNQAIHHLQEAKNCFLKVRETNQEHQTSLDRIRHLDRILSEIEMKAGQLRPADQLRPESLIQKFRLDSACLIFNRPPKRILLYSKKRITLGRHTENDIVLRLVPNTWKKEYDERVRDLLKGSIEDIPVEYFEDRQNRMNLASTLRISGMHAEVIERGGQFYLRDRNSTNGTFVEGHRLNPKEEHPLTDDLRINVAGVLGLEFKFYPERQYENRVGEDPCLTVLGKKSDSCFGIDKKSSINGIKLSRLNNDPGGEEYVILVRGVTIGKDKTNAIAFDGEKVSDIHARIFYRDLGYWIEDLNSREGTWVNGKRVEFGSEFYLGWQAEIAIGETKILFQGMS